MNSTTAAMSARRRAGLEQRRHQALEQQRRGGDVAVVHLVAHVQRLRHQRLELEVRQDARAPARERRRQHRRHPLQALDAPRGRWRRSAAPCRAPRSGCSRRGCRASRSATIHTGIDGLMMPAIGPTARVVMAGREGDLAARAPALRRRVGVVGPAFVEDRADDRALHRAAHALPRRSAARRAGSCARPCRAALRAPRRCPRAPAAPRGSARSACALAASTVGWLTSRASARADLRGRRWPGGAQSTLRRGAAALRDRVGERRAGRR